MVQHPSIWLSYPSITRSINLHIASTQNDVHTVLVMDTGADSPIKPNLGWLTWPHECPFCGFLGQSYKQINMGSDNIGQLGYGNLYRIPQELCALFPCHCVFMMTSSNGNIFRVTGPLCGEFIGHRWIPLTKVSDAELWSFLWSAPEWTVE